MRKMRILIPVDFLILFIEFVLGAKTSMIKKSSPFSGKEFPFPLVQIFFSGVQYNGSSHFFCRHCPDALEDFAPICQVSELKSQSSSSKGTTKMPRSKAFSGKQKKLQLQNKKQTKQIPGKGRHTGEDLGNSQDNSEEGFTVLSGQSTSANASIGLNLAQPESTTNQSVVPRLVESGRSKYALKFRNETKESLELGKKMATKTITPVSPEYLECQVEDFFTPELNIPVRPAWDYSLSREELDSQERRYFNNYLKNIESRFEMSELSYFELNLETWRQYWRVVEMSDILLCIVDIRYPALLFPPKLYEVCQSLGKDVILLLNKIDLAPAPLVVAWKAYFKNKFPKLEVLCFTSYPSYNMHGNSETSTTGRRKKGKPKMAAEGAMKLFQVCESLVGTQVDLNGWKDKILAEMNSTDEGEDQAEFKCDTVDQSVPDLGYYEFKKYLGGILTLGCIGQPNVGKSSVINAVMGKKVVSVSKTPGHTKHFQTIFLTPNVRLCDCPGLVFPSKVPKPLQVLSGSYPIAQLRDPISMLKYLAERLDLPRLLAITHAEGKRTWSAYDVADGWALKRGFYTAKASRLDASRAANHILRLALDGRVCLCLQPPNYNLQKDNWSQDPRVDEIEAIQAKPKKESGTNPTADDQFSESDDDDADADTPGGVGSGSEPEGERRPEVRVQNKFALLLGESESD